MCRVTGCGGAPTPEATPPSVDPEAGPGLGETTPADEPPVAEPPADEVTFASQMEQGGALYATTCASCHGANGEGGKAPAVVGLDKGALPLDPPKTAKHRKEQFKTVLDVGAFAMKTMPPDAPGSLSEAEYLAILAFDLKANGIDLDQPLTLELAKTLDIPRK